MNINTLYFEKFGRTISIVTPNNKEEARQVEAELDNFCLFCPTDTDTYDDCAGCSILKFVELLNKTFPPKQGLTNISPYDMIEL